MLIVESLVSGLAGGAIVAVVAYLYGRVTIAGRHTPPPKPVEGQPPDHLRILVDLADSTDRKTGDLLEEIKALRGASAQLVEEMRGVRDESRKFRVLVFGAPDGNERPADMAREADRERQIHEYMRAGGVDRRTAEERLAENFIFDDMRVEGI